MTLTREHKRQIGASELGTRRAVVTRFAQEGHGFHEESDTQQKERQRNAAVAHLHGFLATRSDKASWLCSLPGERWHVERALHDSMSDGRDLELVGYEQCPITYQKAIAYMPRRRWYSNFSKRYQQVRIAQAHYDKREPIKAIASGGTSKLMLADIRDVLLYGEPSTYGFCKKGVRRSFHLFWLDTFSPLGSQPGFDFAKIISTGASEKGAAFAYAFLIGRDQQPFMSIISASPKATTLEKRADVVRLLIEQHGRQCVIDSMMTHDSWNEDGSAKIGTVFGRVLPIEAEA